MGYCITVKLLHDLVKNYLKPHLSQDNLKSFLLAGKFQLLHFLSCILLETS